MPTKGSVLITGCSDGGAGSALAMEFQARGYLVFASSRGLTTMSKLRDVPNVQLVQLDVTKKADIESALETIQTATGGTLTFLVNCAALNHYMPLLDESIDAAKSLFETNVWGVLAVTQAFTPLLMKAKGTAVFISSVSGYLNVPYQGAFAASKRSMEIMAETLRLELAPFHLPQDSLYSEIESTIQMRASGQEGAPRMEPSDYARRVAAEIIKGRSGKFWYGASASIVKFASSYLPTSLMDSGVQVKTGLDKLNQQH
ncbi:NAD(P)-binding protein [Xylariaceae sp. FL1019]|nr:NAD(P)-binding protein [Xylariaceae sp. FL1019]